MGGRRCGDISDLRYCLKVLELVVLILIAVVLNPSSSAVQDYTLQYHDYWVGGERGSVTYTVTGPQLRVLSYDEHGAVTADETRTLSAAEQNTAAELVRQALTYRDAQQCTDSPIYRITVEQGGADVEMTHTVCSPEVASPYSELEDLLAN